MLTATRPTPNHRRVQLMATCLCDAFYADAARATVEILEYLGCTVEFPAGQTCCGQPAFNAGDWDASRRVMRHTAKVFEGDASIVVPSSSCAAMLFHGAQMAFEKEPDAAEIAALGRRTWELSDFIVNALGVTTWPGEAIQNIAFHRSCHSRNTRSAGAALALMKSIKGTEVVPIGESEQCCGFGGTFSVAFPEISGRMGNLKLEHITAVKPDLLVSMDMSCLMHLVGLAEKQGRKIPAKHVSQVLRDALSGAGKLG